MLSVDRRTIIGFLDKRPSKSWVTQCLTRHELSYKPVRVVEDKRVLAVTEQNLCEHIARVNAVINSYRIKDAGFMFSMDQSGCSFVKMTGRSLRKGVGPRNVALIHTGIRTNGNLERVTVMPVISAAGAKFKQANRLPWQTGHFRRVKRKVQTLHTLLPDCYLYQREVSGVNSAVILGVGFQF